ncbi:MAG: DNA topoisomerase IB [Sphingobium sp.]|nr:DNA topoisomerase IB [Sphingobium sp.]
MATHSPLPPRLTHADDSGPGIRRRRKGRYWTYFDHKGDRISDREEIDRLNAIAMPPAYRDCWFCPSPRGHIQATGYDDKGRKQYRYHAEFRAAREAEKYEGCSAFGTALPRLRKRIEADLRKRSVSRDRAVAAVVRLLDLGKVRVGNESYAKTNGSFGATTLRRRHVGIQGKQLRLQYKAKSGKMQDRAITDAALLRFVRQVSDLPGQHLFQYLDEDGEAHVVTSSEVNAYIRSAMGGDFTAKHFRTWGASVLAFSHWFEAKGKTSLKAMLEPVAAALGNTPAISRKSYVHPALITLASAKDGETSIARSLPRKTRYLSREERGFLALLGALEKDAAEQKSAKG